MAFYFALLNVSNKRSEDKNRQSQRHSSRTNRQTRRHSIASLDEQPLNDYRLLPKPLVVTNELTSGLYITNNAPKEEMSRLRESSISSRDETPPPTTERNINRANLRHNRKANFHSFKKNQRDIMFQNMESNRRESSEIDEPTCSRRYQELDLYNNREDSASGEDEIRMISTHIRRGFFSLDSPIRPSSAKSSREESRRTSKASSNSSEILVSIMQTGRPSKNAPQSEVTIVEATQLGPPIENNRVNASKRVTFDNTNNSVIIGGHFLEDRLRWGNPPVPIVDSPFPTASYSALLDQPIIGTTKQAGVNGGGLSETCLEDLRDTPTRTVLQNAANEHAENKDEIDLNKIQNCSRLLRRRSTSDRSGASFCNRGFLLANEELSLRNLEKDHIRKELSSQKL